MQLLKLHGSTSVRHVVSLAICVFIPIIISASLTTRDQTGHNRDLDLPVSWLKTRTRHDSVLIFRGPNRVPFLLLAPASKGTPTKQASSPVVENTPIIQFNFTGFFRYKLSHALHNM
jgi:hypothetical protein